MPQVRIRDKHQVTLPISIVRDANLRENDMLDVAYKNGVITLSVKQAAVKKRSLMDFVGATRGVYGQDPAQVAQYLDSERDTWDR
jgi:bifunctional DNA-binding transcriptional regulator/antitoxin component of YhaV-PrlF toxin-antitoxin module